MGLADTARQIQETSISRELKYLKELRAFTKEWTDEKVIAEYEKLEAYYKTQEGKADEKNVWIKCTDILEKAALADFYRRVLDYAAIKQRKDRDGGGEKAIRKHWDELQRAERGIRKRYEKQRKEGL